MSRMMEVGLGAGLGVLLMLLVFGIYIFAHRNRAPTFNESHINWGLWWIFAEGSKAIVFGCIVAVFVPLPPDSPQPNVVLLVTLAYALGVPAFYFHIRAKRAEKLFFEARSIEEGEDR